MALGEGPENPPPCACSSAGPHLTRGHATVNSRAYAARTAPLHDAGALLEARSVHPGRTAHHHLRALAHTHGIPRGRVTHVLGPAGLTDVAPRRGKGFSLGMGQHVAMTTFHLDGHAYA
ncbi:hypothetical protein GCM10010446_51430 [Streptomyces enissocaesilis]|uniref:Uncharacterized protein n=1 Tax=Streptomyces enissocaesilis TaxID=332589 RepID=A0ABP6K3P2_9ACTN